MVIGEDLGTVEPWLRDALAARGALGTQMLWFERGWSNEPLAPQWWRRNALATVSTHDLPPAAAFLSGSQVTDRLALDLLVRSEAEERAEAAQIVDDWIGALVGQGLLPAGRRPSADEFTAALYGYLALTPALMIGVNLAEAAGEVRSQNMPGTSTEYPNWKLPLCGPAAASRCCSRSSPRASASAGWRGPPRAAAAVARSPNRLAGPATATVKVGRKQSGDSDEAGRPKETRTT